MEKIFYNYVLLDPRTSTTIYVGKGTGNRCKRHFNNAMTGRNSCRKLCNKIRKIFEETGVEPQILKFNETVIEDETFKMEIFLIKRYRDEGYNLCNLTDGGEGSSGRIFSEIKQHMSEDNIRKMCEANLGRKFSEEIKKKMSESKQNISEETRKKIGEARKGKHHSEETISKMSETAKHMSVEHKKKLSIKSKGENNPASKITEEKAIKIKKMLKDDYRICEISKILNISRHIIMHIKSGHSWTYLNII